MKRIKKLIKQKNAQQFWTQLFFLSEINLFAIGESLFEQLFDIFCRPFFPIFCAEFNWMFFKCSISSITCTVICPLCFARLKSKETEINPAVVAWSVKVLVFHSVNSSPEQAVDPIPLNYCVLIVQRQICLVANSQLPNARQLTAVYYTQLNVSW